MLPPLRLLMFIVADISAVIVLGIAEGDMLGIFEQSGKFGLQALAIAGLVIVWRKLEKIEKKREAEWKMTTKQLGDAIASVTNDLKIALEHHDGFARIAQEERSEAARLAREYSEKEDRHFQAIINDRKEWQSLLLQIHKESRQTLQANTAVGRALVIMMKIKSQAMISDEVSGRDLNLPDEEVII